MVSCFVLGKPACFSSTSDGWFFDHIRIPILSVDRSWEATDIDYLAKHTVVQGDIDTKFGALGVFIARNWSDKWY